MFLLLSSGSNAHGQLGVGSVEDAYTFQPCSFAGQIRDSSVIHVATGANHTLILLEFGDGGRELWGCGDGRKGQLGMGYKQCGMSTSFKKVQLSLVDAGLGDYTFKFIEATWETSYAVLCSEGRPDIVISFGSDDYGDLGVGGGSSNSEKDFHFVQFDHLLPSGIRQIQAISTGQRHVVVQLRSDSSSLLVGWGLSRHGQLGSPAGTSFSSIPRPISFDSDDRLVDKPLSYALGIHHTIVHHHSDKIIGLGSDRKGQLQVVRRCSANHADVQSAHSTWNGSYIVVANQGKWEIWSSGSNSRSQLGWTPNEDDVVGVVKFPDHVDRQKSSVSVACGSEHVLALVSHSDRLTEVWGWGWNEHGNLGIGHTEDIPSPVTIWPRKDAVGISNVCGVWAGSGTSWICTETEDDV
ncbi:hypothetical protein CVT25_005253 [Psilocybe cyanescens]|uniref:Uncharacterized protein n=1 Tax=Psilocybe cyanescens TaxID=93625 RepID=A0A409WWW3_PSICY|nr:hypothetical protein CVT25_005253 [Psilocybe cyanescens]